MGTKRCPYCVEEIQEEAIKCKHCGEFLDTETVKTSYNTENVETLIPQNFLKAIGITISSIILDVVLFFNDIEPGASYVNVAGRLSTYIYALSIAATFYLWINFHDYLENFNAKTTKVLVSWYFALICIIKVLIFVIYIFDGSEHLSNILVISILVLATLSTGLSIALGISLQKIKSDFIGLLKELGISMVFLPPLVILSFYLGSTELQVFQVSSLILYEIPTVILAIIFWKAFIR